MDSSRAPAMPADPLHVRAARNPDMLLDRKHVEELFGISKRWLEIAALRGDGPPMIRISRRMVRYRVRDVRTWLDEHRVTSTSDEG